MNVNLLQKFNKNIIKWYPFKNNTKILQIGENKQITEELKTFSKNIEVVTNINNNKKNVYDYIVIYGYENFQKIIEKIKCFLKDDGKILIIGNNSLGINNWSKYSINSDVGVTSLENYVTNLKTIKQVKNEIKDNEFTNINIFYVFPNYQYAELIVKDGANIGSELFDRYNPQIMENEVKVFNERNVLKNINKCSNEYLDLFANSYFIEVSNSAQECDYEFISYNNCRKEEYQLITIKNKDYIIKVPANKKSSKHIENMNGIIEDLKKDKIEIVDHVEKEKLYSKLIKNEATLDTIISEKYNDIDKIIEILNDFKTKVLLKNSIKYAECKHFITLNMDVEKLEKLNFVRNGYWDLIPKNCFYINNEFVFFDQEWKKQYLPVEFIIYRSIINCYDLVRKVNIDEILKKINILEYKKDFEKIDSDLREQIIDKEVYKLMYEKNNLKAIDNLINDNKSLVEENERKNDYIKSLELIIKDLKKDNENKQNYIDILEKNK